MSSDLMAQAAGWLVAAVAFGRLNWLAFKTTRGAAPAKSPSTETRAQALAG